MRPLVSIIMGSTSDMPVMKQAAEFLEMMEIPFEINALSAHRVPHRVMEFAEGAAGRGVKVIIAGAGGAAHLPGVIAAYTLFRSSELLSTPPIPLMAGTQSFPSFKCLPASR